MANENCTVNIPRGHEFAMSDYAGSWVDAPTSLNRRLAFNQFGLKAPVETVQDDGITENLWDITGDEVIVAQRVTGSVSLNPRPEDLQALGRAIFGGAAFATNAKLPGQVCEYFSIGHKDPTVDKVYLYRNLVVSQATFSCQERQLMNLQMQLEGQTRTILSTVSGNWPTLSLSLQQPFCLKNATLSIAGTGYPIKRVNFTVNNNILAEDFYNSLTRNQMPSAGQSFMLEHDSPWDTASEVAQLGIIREAAVTLEFLSGTKRLYLEFPRLFTTMEEPEINGRPRVNNTYRWKAKWIPGDAINAPVRITVVTS